MDEYELHGHLNEKLFRAIGNCFENLSSSVGSISEEIYSRQAVYFSYTLVRSVVLTSPLPCQLAPRLPKLLAAHQFPDVKQQRLVVEVLCGLLRSK